MTGHHYNELVDIMVRSLAGTELSLTLAPDTTVQDLKMSIKGAWGVPVSEQRLVCMGGTILKSNVELCDLATSEGVNVFMIRGPAFRFQRSLAHPRIKLCSTGAGITHGGPDMDGYQAAFLSDVLDVGGCYTVRFKLEDVGKNRFQEMYVGVAPDANRNWSNLKGANLNRKGFLVDAFDESGWNRRVASGLLMPFAREHQVRNIELMRLRSEIADIRNTRDTSDEDICLLDFGADGAPEVLFEGMNDLGHASERYASFLKTRSRRADELQQLHDEILEGPDLLTFILDIDMPNAQLRFSNGSWTETLIVPGLEATQIRCCATVGCKGQSVYIVDE